MNPEDLAALSISSGDRVQVVSDHGRIVAIAAVDTTLRRGVVTMTHGWGWLPDEVPDRGTFGVSTNMLISSAGNLEPINSMPRMSAIPVNILPMTPDRAKDGRAAATTSGVA
jgi:anaerobic selenocysteine-containing dehydrogenase